MLLWFVWLLLLFTVEQNKVDIFLLPGRSRWPWSGCSSRKAHGSCSGLRRTPPWRCPSAPRSRAPCPWGPRSGWSRTPRGTSPPGRLVPSRSERGSGSPRATRHSAGKTPTYRTRTVNFFGRLHSLNRGFIPLEKSKVTRVSRCSLNEPETGFCYTRCHSVFLDLINLQLALSPSRSLVKGKPDGLFLSFSRFCRKSVC